MVIVVVGGDRSDGDGIVVVLVITVVFLLSDSEQITESGLVVSVACCLSTWEYYSISPNDLY